MLRHNDRRASEAKALAAVLLRVHRWWNGDHRLLLANMGAAREIDLVAAVDAPANGWRLDLSTSDPAYGGCGDEVTITGGQVFIPARTAVILTLDKAKS